MLSFNKIKASIMGFCLLTSIAFLMAALSIFIQDQPANVAFTSLISSILLFAVAAVLFIDFNLQRRTLKATIVMNGAEPVYLLSQDADDLFVRNINSKIKRKEFTARIVFAHLVSHFEQRKSLNTINKNSMLNINIEQLNHLSTSMKQQISDKNLVATTTETTATKEEESDKESLVVE